MATGVTEGDAAVKVAVVDDDPMMHAITRRVLGPAGYELVCFGTAIAARDALAADPTLASVVLTDLHMPGMSGQELLAWLRAERPEIVAIMMTGQATIDAAVAAMREGAYDFLVKPFSSNDVLLAAVRRGAEHGRLVERADTLQRRLDGIERFDRIVGGAASMHKVFSLIRSVAPTDSTVLVLGESGTGKELVARAIHERSRRSGKRFVAFNCAALTDTLLESELFGHERGAFTGANASRRGLFEEASGGSLFLDEVGELRASTQVSLLRVLQEREVRPVGSNVARPVDVRVIGATHRDLEAAVRAGTFRQDLYYRLKVIAIDVPPLRERREDIPMLAAHFAKKHADRAGRAIEGVSAEAIDAMTSYHWPGNVRELENAIERAVVLGPGPLLVADDLPPELRAGAPTTTSDGELPTLAEAKEQCVRVYLPRVMRAADGNLAEAARISGMDRSNFRRLAKKYGL